MADVEPKGDTAELADVRAALKAPDWYDLTAWAELVVLKREQAEARVAELEAERDELRTKVTDAAVIAVAFDHEFRAIAKALGLGSSATAGEIAETVGDRLAAIAEIEALLWRLRCPGPGDATLAQRVTAVINWSRKIRDGEWSPAGAMSYGIDPDALAAHDAAAVARARVAEVEGARLWVMEGLRSSEVRAGEPTDAEMEAAGAVDKRLLTAGEVNDLCRQVEGLRTSVAELEVEQRWVPVDSQLPDAGVPVLFVGPDVQQAVAVYVGGDDPWRLDADRTMAMEASEVTHWRPLPAGPEVQP